MLLCIICHVCDCLESIGLERLCGQCVMSVLFVLNYGEHYDWWRSHEIWIGTVFAVVCKVIP